MEGIVIIEKGFLESELLSLEQIYHLIMLSKFYCKGFEKDWGWSLKGEDGGKRRG